MKYEINVEFMRTPNKVSSTLNVKKGNLGSLH